MHSRKRTKLNRTRLCLGHEGSQEKTSTMVFRTYRSPSIMPNSKEILAAPYPNTSPAYPAFKRKRTWMFIIVLSIITLMFNFVPSIVFADVSVVPRGERYHREVKPTNWDPVTSSGNDIVPIATTPVSLLHELSTPPLTTPSNYRTWKNTNRVPKNSVKVGGDDFHVVGANEVTNRVDVDWENDVIAFEDEDDDATGSIGDDENIFYYYDDGGEDSYDGKSSMEGIHHNADEEGNEDIVVFDGDIYPKVSIG